MQNILDFLSETWDSLVSVLQEFTSYLLDKLLIISIDLAIWLGETATNFFSSIINGLGLDTQLNAYVTQLHPSIGYVFDALNIATYIQIVVAAYITRLVLKFTLPSY